MEKQVYPGANDIVTGGIDEESGVPVLVADAKDKNGLYKRGTYRRFATAHYKGRDYICKELIGVALELKRVVA